MRETPARSAVIKDELNSTIDEVKDKNLLSFEHFVERDEPQAYEALLDQ